MLKLMNMKNIQYIEENILRLEASYRGGGIEISLADLLNQGKTDKYAEPEAVAQKMLKFAYAVGKANRPKGQTAAQFARIRMDALGLGSELTSIPWGSKKPIPLPPSKIKGRSDVPNK